MAQKVHSDLDFLSAARLLNLPEPVADSEPARKADLVRPVVILADVKAYNVPGGTFSAGADRTRVLNTVQAGASYVSLSANQFTLASGTWFIRASAPAFYVDYNHALLWDVPNSLVVAVGTATNCQQFGTGRSEVIRSEVNTVVTLDGSTALELRHYASSTYADFGFGVATNVPTRDSIYSVVVAQKLS